MGGGRGAGSFAHAGAYSHGGHHHGGHHHWGHHGGYHGRGGANYYVPWGDWSGVVNPSYATWLAPSWGTWWPAGGDVYQAPSNLPSACLMPEAYCEAWGLSDPGCAAGVREVCRTLE